ncbi:TRAP-type C4-dicarboxylate transport system, small permease component [Sulfitobacter brevis]|uniref:TRAP transporter small permease protein n=2 Tax=Sulfitobacter brevis TaxID=74348 RepID=A0A1I2E4L9_9RHOB|nr:TRAP-type C4-dicarboxylate transport system, small permease component [Sulfitobacter brevis]
MTQFARPDGHKPMPAAVRLIGLISTVCGVLASFMILAAVLITCQMIFVRAVLNQSTVWQTEVVIYLMIGATLIGLPYVQKLRGHVGVDLLPTLLPIRMRRGLSAITLAITAGMIAIMLFYGWEMWHLAWARGWKSETVMAIPLAIPYLAIPVGFALFLLQLAGDFWMVMSGAPIDDKGMAAASPTPSHEDY